MMKLIRFGGLVSQAIFLQFVHLVGLGAFLISAAAGYFRAPSWSVIILGIVFGVGADKLVDVTDVTGMLDKAQKASERGGFMIIVYFVIALVGYVVGAYARYHHEKLKAKSVAPAQSPSKK
ncbi:MAG: hypothetical protein WB816_12865 [Methylocystis sp.]